MLPAVWQDVGKGRSTAGDCGQSADQDVDGEHWPSAPVGEDDGGQQSHDNMGAVQWLYLNVDIPTGSHHP